MVARAAIALCLAALGWAGSAQAQPGSAAQGRVWYGHTRGRAPTAHFTSPQNAQRVHGRVHMEFQVR
jgi:hypothetical protein